MSKRGGAKERMAPIFQAADEDDLQELAKWCA
jgi:hypothetical protein